MVGNGGHLKIMARFDQMHVTLNLPVFATHLLLTTREIPGNSYAYGNS